jgi:hypothetical protein
MVGYTRCGKLRLLESFGREVVALLDDGIGCETFTSGVDYHFDSEAQTFVADSTDGILLVKIEDKEAFEQIVQAVTEAEAQADSSYYTNMAHGFSRGVEAMDRLNRK